VAQSPEPGPCEEDQGTEKNQRGESCLLKEGSEYKGKAVPARRKYKRKGKVEAYWEV